jgi:iron complex transport system ATP-binding protein
VLERVRARCAAGLAALCILHDLNLAASFCDRVALLHKGRVAAAGKPADVLRPDALADSFAAEVQIIEGPRGPVLVPAKSRLDGQGA